MRLPETVELRHATRSVNLFYFLAFSNTLDCTVFGLAAGVKLWTHAAELADAPPPRAHIYIQLYVNVIV